MNGKNATPQYVVFRVLVSASEEIHQQGSKDSKPETAAPYMVQRMP